MKFPNLVILYLPHPAIVDWSSRNRIVHNLVALVVFPGTYQDRYEEESLLWNGGIEVEEATDPVLIDNTIAGSERVGFRIKGEPCYEEPNPDTDWRGNVVRGALHGVHIWPEALKECAKIANFDVQKSFDFGVYVQVSWRSVLLS